MKPLVVFVPGLLGDRWSFKDVQEALGGIPTLSLDYPTRPFSLLEVARMAGETVREGGYIVGTSMGGYVAQIAALLFPEKLGGVVLVNTFASPRRILGWKRLLIRALGPIPKGNYLKEIVRAGMRDAHFGNEEKVKAYVLGVLERLTPEALYHRLKALADAPEIEEFPQGVRTMVMYSEDDPTIPPPERRLLISRVKPEKVVVCKNGGHFPYLFNPQGFASSLAEFVRTERL